MVVGGNIEGFTRVMTTAIALETSKGDLPLALALGLVLLGVVLLLHVSNIALGLWLRGMPWRQALERAGAALERVGLAEQAGSNARTLSGGQQQRLVLARAWALQVQVLLLDEPTASLDPAAKREVEQLMAQFSAAGMTLIFASHNLGQVKRLADRVLYLEDGRLQVDLPADHFFGGPLPPGAAAFLKGELI
jgi:tungstate transport system ATP-binding protein